MGYESHPARLPGGSRRDSSDHAHLRHGRDAQQGFAIGRYLQAAPLLFTRDGHNVFLGDMFRGRPAFLLCSGPSLGTHDLSKLSARGILTCAVNNAAVVYRPQLWVSVDDPAHFADAIWRDPGVFKFVPLCHMEKFFAVREPCGRLTASTQRVGDMPAVFGYRRNEDFQPAQWLHEDTFNWGNHGQRVDSCGDKGSRSVMYVALRMLYYLGVRRVYLLGCDFRMERGRANYAFEQARTPQSINGNNHSYQVMNERFARLLPYFQAEQFEVLNCTEASGLSVFPFCSYSEALASAGAACSGSTATAGMYEWKKK